NKGVWSENTFLNFEKAAGRQSKISSSGNRQIEVISVDSLKEDFSFIKMDVEGSEKKALLGAEKTIRKNLPKLYVCAYHRNEDIFELPLLINSFDERYEFYFRQHKYIPAWESNFYAVAK
ncbi:MAG: FkbM family methyltransferase, partial [Clostridia bacterium]|nr:FkbM family methyltransferase [Clostridia bacterium]